MSEADNERKKLTANWLNALSAASYAAGFITPFVASQTGLLKGVDEGEIVSGSLIWLVTAIALHIAGLVVLTGYDET